MSATAAGGTILEARVLDDVLLVTATSVEIVPGALVSGAGLPAGTKIVCQLSGTSGGPGRYRLEIPGWERPPRAIEPDGILRKRWRWRAYVRDRHDAPGDLELFHWYMTRVRELEADRRRSTEPQDWQAAQREFPGRFRGENARARLRWARQYLALDAWKRIGWPRLKKPQGGDL